VLRWGRRLAERGHDVHLVTGQLSEDPAEYEGVTVHDVPSLAPVTRIPFLRRPLIGKAIGRLGRRLDVDVVHAHYLLPYGYWAAQAGIRPLVMSPWSRDIFTDAASGRGRRRALAAIRGADYFVVNSEANAKASAELGADRERMSEIIWYAELSRFGPEHADPGFRARFGWPDDALAVVSMRNFLPYKNIDVLLRAFAEVAKDEPRARLLLAARAGPLRPKLEALARELEISDLVAFYRAAWDELPWVAASGDVVVTIADTDSTPASLIEVMKSARPVICGFAPSMDEWVNQGEGAEMVPVRDVGAIAAAIRKLLEDPELRRAYGERNLHFVQERLPEEPGVALESLYRKLLAR